MIISRYVKVRALLAIVAAVLALWLLKLVFAYLAELDSLKDSYTYVDALKYIFYTAPEALENYMAIGALLGGVVGLGLLANNSELVAIRAAGISNLRIVSWVMQPALLFVILGLLVSQFVVPTSNQLARQVQHKTDNPMLSSSLNGYWDKQTNADNTSRIINVDYADAQGQLKNITVWQLGQAGELQSISHATTGKYSNSTDKTWQLTDVSQVTLEPNGNAKKQQLTTQTVTLPIAPDSIYLLTRKPEDMSITDLWQHKQFLASHQRQSLEHDLAFWKKVLSPFSVLSLVLVACSFVFGSLRTHSLGLRVVVALLFGLVFSYIQDLVGFISLSTGISPLIMVLLPIVVSAGLGLYLVQRKQ